MGLINARSCARPFRQRRRSSLRLFALVGLALLLLAGCRNTELAPSRPVHISIGGATAMLPVLHELTNEFHRRQPNVFFDVRGGGSQFGEEQTLAGRLNLGASTFAPPPTEDPATVPGRRAGPIDASLVRIPIGIDALALIVHPTNPIEGLTAEQIVPLFNGRVLNWAEVGGPPGEIILISREEGSGARRIFEERLMGGEPVSLTAVVMPTSRDVVDYVAKTPNAIGYVSRGYIAEQLPQTQARAATGDTTGQTPAIRVLSLDGMWPVDSAIQNQLYSLSYPLYLVSRREPTGPQRQFIDFILSPAGQTIVGAYHVRVR